MISRMYFTVWLPAIAVLAIFLRGNYCFPATPVAPLVAITNISVVDTVKEQMLPAQSVIIQGDRIQAVGPTLAIPQGAQVIDGKGQFLIPGLIDAHVHLVHLTDRTHVMGEEFLPMFLGAGVTSVRSTGDGVEAEKRIVR